VFSVALQFRQVINFMISKDLYQPDAVSTVIQIRVGLCTTQESVEGGFSGYDDERSGSMAGNSLPFHNSPAKDHCKLRVG
jgi:hypothetical protein